MTQAAMRKADGSYMQTRTFICSTKGQLTPATNPESGLAQPAGHARNR